ncbi:MAG: hypothetical protein GC150_15940 [Rhizobiales bacterium]|nr:hypothetical protein [Hyphomicrobiales bacterium]
MDLALRLAIAAYADAVRLDEVRPDAGTRQEGPDVSPAAFEAFAAHHVLNQKRHFGLSSDDILSIVTGGRRDSRIDAIAIIVNGEIILDQEDLAVIEGNDDSQELNVEFIFIQATLREYLSQAKIGEFCTGVSSFFSSGAGLEESVEIVGWRLLVERVMEFMQARAPGSAPVLSLYLVWPEQAAGLKRDHLATLELRRRDIQNLGRFAQVNYEIVDGTDLVAMVQAERHSNRKRLQLDGLVAVRGAVLDPAGKGRCWIGYARASELVACVTTDDELDEGLFEENVRHVLRGKSADVRPAVDETLRGPNAARFIAMNNGVTIIAREIEVEADGTVWLTDCQVPNGCQTIFALFENRESLRPEVTVTIKLIETREPDVIHDVVVANNSQNRVEPIQLLSRTPYVRRIQLHIDASLPEGHPAHVRFERRTGEHFALRVGDRNRVVDLRELIAGFVSVFCERPDLAQGSKWRQMLQMVPSKVFNPSHDPELYKIVALIAWRTRQWVSLNRPSWRHPARFHLALAVRRLAEPEPGWHRLEAKPGPGLQRYLTRLSQQLIDDASASRLLAAANEAVLGVLEATKGEDMPLRATNAEFVRAILKVVDSGRPG